MVLCRIMVASRVSFVWVCQPTWLMRIIRQRWANLEARNEAQISDRERGLIVQIMIPWAPSSVLGWHDMEKTETEHEGIKDERHSLLEHTCVIASHWPRLIYPPCLDRESLARGRTNALRVSVGQVSVRCRTW